jgi:nitrate reductase delta subunit
MLTFRALGALITYPVDELLSDLPAIKAAVEDEAVLSLDAHEGLLLLIDQLQAEDLMTQQEEYVGLFDRTRSLSLHLYEHVWGDARERGQAMVRLQTLYKLHGFSHTSTELPDYLPLFCEFLSLVPEKAARAMLSDAAPVIETLRERLAKRGSPYHAVMAALVGLASKSVNPAMLEQISKGALPDEQSFDELDRAWEETPVQFSGAESPATACGQVNVKRPAA